MSGHDHVHGNSSAGDQQRAANATGQKPPNPRYRTKLCRNFPLGTCRYGEHCSYLHIRPVPSPATQGSSPFPTLACSPFFPSIAPSLSFHLPISTSGSHTPTNMATSSSYRAPSEARAQPPNSYRDVRPARLAQKDRDVSQHPHRHILHPPRTQQRQQVRFWARMWRSGVSRCRRTARTRLLRRPRLLSHYLNARQRAMMALRQEQEQGSGRATVVR
ncbi:hypothetical protein C8Q74DRAFT_880437 [Fomes fomentarius]|nr:hypothetical protein C8Q74DRAFT_880437 [Fomes fomentarius]